MYTAFQNTSQRLNNNPMIVQQDIADTVVANAVTHREPRSSLLYVFRIYVLLKVHFYLFIFCSVLMQLSGLLVILHWILLSSRRNVNANISQHNFNVIDTLNEQRIQCKQVECWSKKRFLILQVDNRSVERRQEWRWDNQSCMCSATMHIELNYARLCYSGGCDSICRTCTCP